MIDHDRLFKELLSTFFVEFLELFLPEVLDYLDPASLIPLDKEIFTDVTSGERYEADLVIQARFKNKTEAYFLIHVEHQSYTQVNFGRRMLRYFGRLLDQHDLEIYPIAIFSYDKPKRKEPHVYKMAFPNKLVLQFDYDVIQLNRLSWKNYLDRPNPVASALMAKMQIAPEDRVKVKIACLKMLVGLDLDPARTQLISGFVDTYLELEEEEKQEFQIELNKIIPPEKEEIMNIMTSWKREGIQEGIKEGIQEGRATLLIEMLNYRLGQLAPEVESRIKELPGPKIEELAKALFDFTQMPDLINWLDSHKQ